MPLAKIADFGLATYGGPNLRDPLLTWRWHGNQAKKIILFILLLAPECIDLENVSYDERADVRCFFKEFSRNFLRFIVLLLFVGKLSQKCLRYLMKNIILIV